MTDQPKVTAESPRPPECDELIEAAWLLVQDCRDLQPQLVKAPHWATVLSRLVDVTLVVPRLIEAVSSGVSAARLRELEGERDTLRDNHTDRVLECHELTQQVKALTETLQQLRSYVQHTNSCAYWRDGSGGSGTVDPLCDCGLDDVLKTLEGNSPEGEK